MLKLMFGLAWAVATVLATSTGLGTGCQDGKTSFTKLDYPPIRDMRNTVAIDPQKDVMRGPDTLSVPLSGHDPVIGLAELTTTAARLRNPTPSSDGSIARGEKTYATFCTPCHGKSLAGDGPVIQFFIPPPDLLGEITRGRSDGYMYTYIRFGGAVMPKYGQSVTAAETWDVINYIRHMQRTSPR